MKAELVECRGLWYESQQRGQVEQSHECQTSMRAEWVKCHGGVEGSREIKETETRKFLWTK